MACILYNAVLIATLQVATGHHLCHRVDLLNYHGWCKSFTSYCPTGWCDTSGVCPSSVTVTQAQQLLQAATDCSAYVMSSDSCFTRTLEDLSRLDTGHIVFLASTTCILNKPCYDTEMPQSHWMHYYTHDYRNSEG